MRRHTHWWLLVICLVGLAACGAPAVPLATPAATAEPAALEAPADVRPTAAASPVLEAATVATATAMATAVPMATGQPATATPAPSPTPAPTARLLNDADQFIYVPASAIGHQPATVLVTLHGMGGDGRAFCRGLMAEAERNGWVLVAPTFRYYENWRDPATVVKDDVKILGRLTTMLDALPARIGLRLRPRVLLYGFSRGSQVAHRFALAYPRRVLGVAALSAGSYTLPVDEWTANGQRKTLPLPYGTADLARYFGQPEDVTALKQVSFWVSVGGNDTREADAPAAWTPYIGPNRLARARAFKAALDRLGVPALLTVFPGAGHAETPEMRAAASAFLRGLGAAS